MMSDDVKNFELFVDKFVTPAEKVSPPIISQWNNSYSFDNAGGSLSSNQVSQSSSSGTELWGEKSRGSDWRATLHKPTLENSDFRPEVQNRSLQWKPQTAQSPLSENMQHLMTPESFSSFPEMPPAPQNPNHIQNLVCDLIRQNNMKKQSHYNIPPWIDVTKPPPPLPNRMSASNVQYNSQMQQQLSNNCLEHPGAIPTLSFPQTFSSNMQFANADGMVNPVSTSMLQEVSQKHVNDLSNVCYAMQSNHQVPPDQIRTQDFMPSSKNILPTPHETGRLSSSRNDTISPVKYTSLDENFNNTTDLQLQKPNNHYEQPQSLQNQPFLANENNVNKISATRWPISKTQSVESDESTQSVQAVNRNFDSMNGHKGEVIPQQRNGSESSSKNSESIDGEHPKRNISNHLSKKRSFNRQPSAADLDMNWRSRDNERDQKEMQVRGDDFRRSSLDNPTKRPVSRSFSHRGSGDDSVFKPSGRENNGASNTDHFQAREANKVAENENTGAHHVTAKSKVKLLSWLQRNNENACDDCVTKEIRHLQITDSESDLNRFIEASQGFATNEAKMREIAEILCNKALGDRRFARNVAVLCDRLSFMMVHGTKFRNVVLNVMQGHYKNRDQIFAASLRGNQRWFGFVTFLVEIFLNMRTSTRERLVVLTTPVLNCLFQVLHRDRVTQEHIDCFGQLFRKVGPAFEAETVERLDKLMEEIRDRCVTSQSPFVKRALLHCVELYASKWETVTC